MKIVDTYFICPSNTQYLRFNSGEVYVSLMLGSLLAHLGRATAPLADRSGEVGPNTFSR